MLLTPGSEVPELSCSRLPGSEASRLRCSRLPVSEISRLPRSRLVDSVTPRLHCSKFPRLRGSQIPMLQVSNASCSKMISIQIRKQILNKFVYKSCINLYLVQIFYLIHICMQIFIQILYNFLFYTNVTHSTKTEHLVWFYNFPNACKLICDVYFL